MVKPKKNHVFMKKLWKNYTLFKIIDPLFYTSQLSPGQTKEFKKRSFENCTLFKMLYKPCYVTQLCS